MNDYVLTCFNVFGCMITIVSVIDVSLRKKYRDKISKRLFESNNAIKDLWTFPHEMITAIFGTKYCTPRFLLISIIFSFITVAIHSYWCIETMSGDNYYLVYKSFSYYLTNHLFYLCIFVFFNLILNP